MKKIQFVLLILLSWMNGFGCTAPGIIIAHQFSLANQGDLTLDDLDVSELPKEEDPYYGQNLRKKNKCLVRKHTTKGPETLFGICMINGKIWVFNRYYKEAKAIGFKDKSLSEYIYNSGGDFSSPHSEEHVRLIRSVESLLKKRKISYTSDGLVEIEYDQFRQLEK